MSKNRSFVDKEIRRRRETERANDISGEQFCYLLRPAVSIQRSIVVGAFHGTPVIVDLSQHFLAYTLGKAYNKATPITKKLLDTNDETLITRLLRAIAAKNDDDIRITILAIERDNERKSNQKRT